MFVSARHLTYTYDGADALALDDASAVFAPGWTGVVGPNGAGKSALPRPHTAVSATCRTAMTKNPHHLRSAKSASTARSRRYLTRVRMLQRRASTLGTAPWKLDDSPGYGYTVELRLQGRRAIEGAPHLEILHLSAS